MKIIFYECSVGLVMEQPNMLTIAESNGTFYLVSNQLTLNSEQITLVLRFLDSNATDEHTIFLIPNTLKKLFFGQAFEPWRDRVLDKDEEIAQTKVLAIKEAMIAYAQSETNLENIQFTEVFTFIPSRPKFSIRLPEKVWEVVFLGTYFPISIFVVLVLLIMFASKPEVLEVKKGQIPEMLKKADEKLENNIEETLYWAQDRILKIYNENPNIEKTEKDKENIDKAEALEEAMRNVESASGVKLQKPVSPAKPITLEQRKQATEEIMKAKTKAQYLTLPVASSMSNTDAEKLLNELSEEEKSKLFVLSVGGNQYKVYYLEIDEEMQDKIKKEREIIKLPEQIKEKIKKRCRETTSLAKESKSLLREVKVIGDNPFKRGVVESISSFKSNDIKPDTPIYIPTGDFTCKFSELKTCNFDD